MVDRICYLYEQNQYDVDAIAHWVESHIPAKPGQCVFVKPNMVINPWRNQEYRWVATVTHPSLIEATLIVLKTKMCGTGRVIIGDAPMARSNHDETLSLLRLEEIIKKYETNTFQIELIDIRDWYWKYIGTMCVSRKRLPGDPRGVKMVNLKSDSAFANKCNKNYEAFDDIQPVSEFHNEVDNIFSISASILSADLVINLPKLKTHRIAGMTCAMKNLVGINANKNCVPHNTCGTDAVGGDVCPANAQNVKDETKGVGGVARKILRKKMPWLNYCFVPVKMIYDLFQKEDHKRIGYGMWHGNDTIWRSIVDLNRILLYANKSGEMTDCVQRKYVCIVDAIVAGQGEGPLYPDPIQTNMLLVSSNPVVVDTVACEIIGFDWCALPFIAHSFNQHMKYPLVDFKHDEIVISKGDETIKLQEVREKYSFDFAPTSGWKSHVEKHVQIEHET